MFTDWNTHDMGASIQNAKGEFVAAMSSMKLQQNHCWQ